jgi:hypothetical protein
MASAMAFSVTDEISVTPPVTVAVVTRLPLKNEQKSFPGLGAKTAPHVISKNLKGVAKRYPHV